MVGQVVACHGHGSNEEAIQFEAHDDTLSTSARLPWSSRVSKWVGGYGCGRFCGIEERFGFFFDFLLFAAVHFLGCQIEC